MDEHDMREVAREAAEDKLITEAFQHLLDTYLASRHRKKVDIITKAFRRTLYHASHCRSTNCL